MMRLGQIRLGQSNGQGNGQPKASPYQSSVNDGLKAVKDWDALLFRLGLVKDDGSRSDILTWMGRADIPGSPAERYAAVRDTLTSGEQPDDIFVNRVSQLQDIVSELGQRVTAAEASGTLPSPTKNKMGQGSTPEAGNSLGQCITGGVALLGLIVVPLLLD